MVYSGFGTWGGGGGAGVVLGVWGAGLGVWEGELGAGVVGGGGGAGLGVWGLGFGGGGGGEKGGGEGWESSVIPKSTMYGWTKCISHHPRNPGMMTSP